MRVSLEDGAGVVYKKHRKLFKNSTLCWISPASCFFMDALSRACLSSGWVAIAIAHESCIKVLAALHLSKPINRANYKHRKNRLIVVSREKTAVWYFSLQAIWTVFFIKFCR